MKAVILCAGRGERMMPLTRDRPKCMIKIFGRPILHWNIYNLMKSGINDIIVVCGYKKEVIRDYFYDIPNHIEYVEQKNLNGTGGAVSVVEEFVDDSFLVLTGDTLYLKKDLERLMEKENSLLYVNGILEKPGIGAIKFKDGKVLEITDGLITWKRGAMNVSGYHFTRNIFDAINSIQHEEKGITHAINNLPTVFTGISIKDWYHFTVPRDIESINEDYKKIVGE